METLLGLIFGGMGLFVLVWLGVGIASFVFWLKMLIAAAKHEFEHKAVWILVIVLGQLPGAIVFYFMPYQQIKAAKKATQPVSSQ